MISAAPKVALQGIVLVVALLCAACATNRLMPTPNLYLNGSDNPFDTVPEARKSPYVVVPFVTDRNEVLNDDGSMRFGFGRSMSLVVGTCRVGFGKNLSWEELVEDSTSPVRQFATKLSIQDVRRLAEYPATPYVLNLLQNATCTPQQYADQARRTREILHETLHEETARFNQHDVLLYIHGFNNSFEDAVLLTAQFWHFLGRKGIPIAYTWPAGHGGLLRYMTDSESGEFTIYHLKTFLRDLASSPDVHKINVLSHSRGTDVLTAALRELKLETSPAGDAKATLKLGQVVMAAPDIDAEVFGQRFLAEELNTVADDFTIYLSPNDRALLVSKWLHSSVSRLGLLSPQKIPDGADRLLSHYNNVHIINADVPTNFIGHDFFYTNPAVSSDLILLLREGRAPGAENGRPLRKIMTNLYSVGPNYPEPEKLLGIIPKAGAEPELLSR